MNFRRLALLLVPAATLSAILTFLAAGPAAALNRGADGSVKFIILHTNDIHGQVLPRDARDRKDEKIGGIAALDAYITKERAAAEKAGAKLLLIDSGDWYQGTPEGNYKKDGIEGALIIDWMNRARYDAAVIGNHEFDFGRANVSSLIARAKFNILGANVLAPVAAGPNTTNGDSTASKPVSLAPIAKPYAIFEHGGVKLSVVGLLTSDTPRMVAEGRLGDVTIPDQYKEGRKWYDRASKESDIVIFATHCGRDEDGELARRVPEAPVILGGHSHTKIKQPNFAEHEPAALTKNPWKAILAARTYIVQSGSRTEAVDRIEMWIDPADKKIEKIDTKVIDLYIKDVGESEDTKKWLDAEAGDIIKEMATVIAELTEPIASEAEGRPSADPAGILATEALLWHGKNVEPGVAVAFNNPSGIRAKVKTGPLTKRGVYEIIPFDNTSVILTMTAKDLLAIMSDSMAGRGRIISAGMDGELIQDADGVMDTTKLLIGGKPFDNNAKYRIIVNSFIADGKGGATGFTKGTERRDTGALVRDSISEYVSQRKSLALEPFFRLKLKSTKTRNAEKPQPAGAGSTGEKK
ncbi:MAG: bifunctional metallophosphatase/5'-nucleotidase [Planctomycetota bacterium]